MKDVGRFVWDAIVIGAGPVGILAWQHLRARGLRVLLIEAGGRDAAPAVDEERWRFRSTRRSLTWLRSHAVGGRSHVWGGWASMFPAEVFSAGDWPVSRRAFGPGYRRVREWLRVAGGSAHCRYLPVSRKLGWRVRGCAAMARDDSPWLRARAEARTAALASTVACQLDVRRDRAVAVQALDSGGRPVSLSARRFLLAASPIESARLLLASGAGHPAIGCGLTDHVLMSFLLIDRQPCSADRAERQMHGALIDPFDGPRPALRSHRGRFTLETMGPVPLTNLPAGWLRAQGVDPDQPGLATYIHAMGEQFPRRDRRVSLVTRSYDALGRRMPVLHLGLGADDRALAASMRQACLTVADTLATGQAMLLSIRDSSVAPLVYHPAGTCMMGRNDDAPCDARGRLREWRNVWLCDASVMPTSGDRHPTLTVLVHTLRAAQDAVRERV